MKTLSIGYHRASAGIRTHRRAHSQVCSAIPVVVASTNPAKVIAVKQAVEKCFPNTDFEFTSQAANSNVPDQPFGDEQTLAGAVNRVENLQSPAQSGLLVAIEGGVGWADKQEKELECFAWVAVRSASSGVESTARTGSFVLPDKLTQLITKEGFELADATDLVFKQVKSGRGSGTIGYLTQDLMTRTDYYEHAIILALVPFMNADVYGEKYRL